MDQVNHAAWVGRSIEDFGGISARAARLIHATLGDASKPAPEPGAPLPPLWHWCAFPPEAALDALGEDGHPRGSDILPPMPFSRRMWAGGSLSFHAPLRVGEPMHRRSTLRKAEVKEGASGPMVLAVVDHVISGPRGVAVEERQDIVYLDMPKTYAPPKARPIEAPVTGGFNPTETLLFRYSALTHNAHRIHYDRPYAEAVEKYPGLVVHGPLQATLLAAEAVRQKGRMPLSFDYRGVHPMFAGTAAEIAVSEEDAATLRLWTGQDGHQCMEASALWMETV